MPPRNRDAVCLDGFVNTAPLDIANTDPSYPAYGAGVYGDEIVEPLPRRIPAPSEDILQKGNSWIVLGRDRTGSRASGHGGAAETGCSAIDICVGMGGPCPTNGENVDPNFKADGARIYVSQKTNIDVAFNTGWRDIGLRDGILQGRNTRGAGMMSDSFNESGIGIKADAVRIIGTNGIKLVTRTQNRDSQGLLADYNGIELIANMDDSDLQYMVKGNNLVACLNDLEKRINAVMGVLLEVIRAQNTYNKAILNHTHQITPAVIGGSAAGPVTANLVYPKTSKAATLVPSGCKTITDFATESLDVFKNRINLNINWNTKYLTGGDTANYILSQYNKVN
tara:strand:- start:10614 stop:11627 length:1014 start_codon:yes stop_codon:yes gene_type:complete